MWGVSGVSEEYQKKKKDNAFWRFVSIGKKTLLTIYGFRKNIGKDTEANGLWRRNPCKDLVN